MSRVIRLSVYSSTGEVTLSPEMAYELAEHLHLLASAVVGPGPCPKLVLPCPEGEVRAALQDTTMFMALAKVDVPSTDFRLFKDLADGQYKVKDSTGALRMATKDDWATLVEAGGEVPADVEWP